jgi:hypothetical protein
MVHPVCGAIQQALSDRTWNAINRPYPSSEPSLLPVWPLVSLRALCLPLPLYERLQYTLLALGALRDKTACPQGGCSWLPSLRPLALPGWLRGPTGDRGL